MIKVMYRVNKIITDPLYKEKFQRIQELEKDREFCNHTMAHFIDVARIAYIIDLEENLEIDKEIIYAAAVLHDIGRADEYDNGIPHHQAGSDIAKSILSSINEFKEDEVNDIISAIKEHRSTCDHTTILGNLIYKSDKLSRNCFCCPASDKCNWSEDKKNNYLKV